MGQFDGWVLQTAARHLARWPVDPAQFPALWLNVNVSASHLGQVAAHLGGTALLAPWQVLIEITERVLTQTADTDATTLRGGHQEFSALL